MYHFYILGSASVRNLTEVLHSMRAEIQEWTIGRERGYTQLLLLNQRENSVFCTHIHHTHKAVLMERFPWRLLVCFTKIWTTATV